MTPEVKIADANRLPITEKLAPFAKQFDVLTDELRDAGLPYLVLIGTAEQQNVDNPNHHVAGLLAAANGSSKEVGRLIAGILSTQNPEMQAGVVASIIWSLKEATGYEKGDLKSLTDDEDLPSSPAWPNIVGAEED